MCNGPFECQLSGKFNYSVIHNRCVFLIAVADSPMGPREMQHYADSDTKEHLQLIPMVSFTCDSVIASLHIINSRIGNKLVSGGNISYFCRINKTYVPIDF